MPDCFAAPHAWVCGWGLRVGCWVSAPRFVLGGRWVWGWRVVVWGGVGGGSSGRFASWRFGGGGWGVVCGCWGWWVGRAARLACRWAGCLCLVGPVCRACGWPGRRRGPSVLVFVCLGGRFLGWGWGGVGVVVWWGARGCGLSAACVVGWRWWRSFASAASGVGGAAPAVSCLPDIDHRSRLAFFPPGAGVPAARGRAVRWRLFRGFPALRFVRARLRRVRLAFSFAARRFRLGVGGPRRFVTLRGPCDL